jgi:predicted SAM-dependent methyltransferase
MPEFSGYVDTASRFAVSGWSDPPSQVTVVVSGVTVGNANIGWPRFDAREAGFTEAAGFHFRLTPYLKEGKNTVEVAFPNGDPVPGSPKSIDYEPRDDIARRLNVGCGPHHRKAGWHNIDIRQFPGVDEVRDATLPFDDIAPLEYIYSEHFLEHLTLEGAIRFLQNSVLALDLKGRIRISTPALEWVLTTHFDLDDKNEERVVMATLGTNRAFHGWGHQFVWSKPMLRATLLAVGFQNVKFWTSGESDDPNLIGLEQHGDFHITKGWPSVWVVEATPGVSMTVNDEFFARCEEHFTRHVRGGH